MLVAMPTSLSLEQHLVALDVAARAMVDRAVAAGLSAKVPTCPRWDVTKLLAHQTMVHRWATAQVRGDDPAGVPDEVELLELVRQRPAVVIAGADELVDVLETASDDLEALTFLNDAPPPRQFWARRQAHETTIHAVDALAAQLGRVPTAGEAAIGPELAADGIDELLRGFFTRGRSKLFAGTPFSFAVLPDDIDRRWIVRVDERLTVDDGDPRPDGVASTWTATAAQLYLGLWNRGREMTVGGDADIAGRWRASQRVRWR